MLKKHKRVVTIVVSLFFIFILVWLSSIFTTDEVVDYIKNFGIYAPLGYIFLQTVGQIFAPISTSIFFVAGFILFGKRAIIYMIIIWSITSITNFLIARRFGEKIILFFVGKNGLRTVKDIVRGLSSKQYLTLRLLTFYMNDFASYAFGLTNISFPLYLFVTIISIIPWAILMTVLMQEDGSILITTIKVMSTMLPFTIIGYLFFKKISLRRLYNEICFRLDNRNNR